MQSSVAVAFKGTGGDNPSKTLAWLGCAADNWAGMQWILSELAKYFVKLQYGNNSQ